jgi:GT2 family glycosyltransferase
MEISRHPDIEKDFRALKRSAAPQESLEAWERLLRLKGLGETPAIDSFPGFGTRKVFKGRVVPLKENVGKSKGYRVIFEMADDDNCIILVFSRHGIHRNETELMARIKNRLN